MPKRDHKPLSTKNLVITLAGLGAVMAAGLWFARNLEAPGRLDREHLQETAELVIQYHLDHGAPPETLEELVEKGYTKEPITDRLGNPIVYNLTNDNSTVELINLGADGEPGGHMFKADTPIRFDLPQK
ncbi:MAG: type II secretion system protein GspG [Verrucomicrobiota bacterium]